MNYNLAFTSIRKANNMTQKQLADIVNVTPGYISKIEKGEKVPTLEVIERICNATKTPFPLFALIAYENHNINGESRKDMSILKNSLLGLLTDANNTASK